ncbi:MAG: T9SS type A sorting domain-containing protein [Chitinispirillales bacterium]|nr:T9SS type A sorting domain-containing protein [Chitinispirillales bacterium]
MPNTAARPVTPLVTLRGKTLSVNDSPDSRVRVKVVNMAGKTVANFNARGGADLSLRRLPAGTYIVEARRVRDGMRTTSSIVLR